MRYILLASDDFVMFHQDIDLLSYDFYYRHKDTFRRMYKEQGKEFWVRFMLSFRSAQCDDIMRIFDGKIKRLSDYVDCFYINVHEEFIEGPYSRAKQFFEDIVTVTTDQGYLSLLHLRTLAKDPFHRKETKDIYKRFFGDPNDLSSYSKVFILLPMYRRLAGSLCVCLRRWMDAPEMTDPTDYWVPPPPGQIEEIKKLAQNDDLQRVDILKVTFTKEDTVIGRINRKDDETRGKKSSKCPDEHLGTVGTSRKRATDGVVLSKGLLDRLGSLYEMSNSYLGVSTALPGMEGFPEKPLRKGQRSLPSSGLDGEPLTMEDCEGLDSKTRWHFGSMTMTAAEALKRIKEISATGEYNVHLNIKSRYKIEMKISVKRAPGSKGFVDYTVNGRFSEIKSLSASDLKDGDESCVHCGRSLTPEDESKAAEESIPRKKAEISEQSGGTRVRAKSTVKTFVKQGTTMTSAEADSQKKAKPTDCREKAKAAFECGRKAKTAENSGVKQESKATGDSDALKNVEATKESDSKEKAKAAGKSNVKQDSKATADSDSLKNVEAAKKSASAENLAEATENSCASKQESKADCDAREKAKTTKEFSSRKKTVANKESESREKDQATEKSNGKQASKATADSDSVKNTEANKDSDSKENLAKATGKSNGKPELEAPADSDSRKLTEADKDSDSSEKAKTTEKSDGKQASKATADSDSLKKTKATKKSASIKKAKATSAKQDLKAAKESKSEKKSKVAVDESDVGKVMDDHVDKESSRPGSRNVRSCTNCGLQEPAPKVFKKCKRCKDKGCLDPPYYCGRDCQVSDWTSRHRQEHDKTCA